MPRPAALWKRKGQSPFIARRIKDGPKVGLNWDWVTPSDNHQKGMEEVLEDLRALRINLVRAEAAGKYSAARKIRREINKVQEQELYLEHSACHRCGMGHLHCRCKDDHVVGLFDKWVGELVS